MKKGSDVVIKIGVDLHGVIDSHVSMFKKLSFFILSFNRMMRIAPEVELYIISGPPKEDVIKELEQYGIVEGSNYTDVYTIVDFLRTQPDVNMWKDEKGTWWTEEENWWGAKAKICKQLGINVMVDNTDKYKPYFKGTGIRFVLYEDMI